MNNRLKDMQQSPSPSLFSRERLPLTTAIGFAIAATGTLAFLLFKLFTAPDWRTSVLIGLVFLSGLLDVIAIFLIRRNSPNLAIMLMLSGFYVIVLALPFLYEGVGIILLVEAVMLSAAIPALTMPGRYSFSGLFVGTVVGSLALIFDIYLRIERVSLPQLSAFIPGLVLTIFVVLSLIIALGYSTYTLRAKISLGILFASGLSVAVLAYFVANRAESIVTVITQKFENSVQARTEDELKSFIHDEADTTDKLFSFAAGDLMELADYRTQLDNQSALLSQGTYWDARTRLFTLSKGQYGNQASDPSSVFIPSTVAITDELLIDVNTTAYMDFSVPSILKKQPEIVAIYYISELGATTYYPNINLAEVVPPDFDALSQPFYQIATPQNNPERTVKWTRPYQDPAGAGLIVTGAVPVYSKGGNFKGVIGADVKLASVTENISAIKMGQTGFAFLLNSEGHIISMPQKGYEFFNLQPEVVPVNAQPQQTLSSVLSVEFQKALVSMEKGENKVAIVHINGIPAYVAYSPLKTTGYSMALIVPKKELEAPILASQTEIEDLTLAATKQASLILVGLIFMAVLLSAGLGRVIARPLKNLTSAVQRITDGDLTYRVAVETEDETGALAQSFNSMTAKLNENLFSLEQRVAERTGELAQFNIKSARRAAQFEAISRVARTISSTQNLESLLNQTTQAISQQFGFYHVGVFLIDSRSEYAVLAAANTEGGRRMLARQHRLKVGETGIVGFVTGTGLPRLALDTGADATHFVNPDLPDTHSEIALPLRFGNEVIGALDVQSTEVNAFTQEDVNILSTLADQVSIAIQNARSYERTAQALKDAEVASRRGSELAWGEFMKSKPLAGYEFDGLQSKPLSDAQNKADKEGLSIPLRLRGHVIGALKISAIEQQREWTQHEIAIAEAAAERTAIALEGARLLQEAQKRAARERAIGEISSKIGSLVNLENIVQTAIQELSRTMPNAEVAIQLIRDEEKEPGTRN